MRKEFQSDSPELVLLISDSKKPSDIEKIFQKGFDQSNGAYQLLPLCVESKNLEKMLTALKLMDVRGAYFTGKSGEHLPKGDDAVAFKNDRFKSIGVLNETYRSFFKDHSKSLQKQHVVIWGPPLSVKEILPHIRKYKPASLKRRSLKSSPAGTAINETHIFCGQPDRRGVQRLMSTIPAGSPILDIRTEIIDYRPITHKKLFKNNDFLAHWVESALSYWGFRDIDHGKLTRSISRLCVK